MDNRMFISIRRDMGSKACHLVSGIQHFCHRVKLSTHYNSMTCNNGCGLNMQQRGNNPFSTMIGFWWNVKVGCSSWVIPFKSIFRSWSLWRRRQRRRRLTDQESGSNLMRCQDPFTWTTLRMWMSLWLGTGISSFSKPKAANELSCTISFTKAGSGHQILGLYPKVHHTPDSCFNLELEL